MNINIFTKYWELLKKEYQDTTHNTQDLKLYYSILKEYTEKDLKKAIKQVLKYQKYFPRINEIVQYLPTENNKKVSFDKDGTMLWNGVRCELIPTTQEEIEEMEKFLNGI